MICNREKLARGIQYMAAKKQHRCIRVRVERREEKENGREKAEKQRLPLIENPEHAKEKEKRGQKA